MGYSTILALPIFQDTTIGMAVAVAVAIVVAAIVTFILGFEENAPTQAAPVAESSDAAEEADDSIVAVADGKMIPLDTVSDETFASKVLGDGVAFELDSDTIAAPCSGI